MSHRLSVNCVERILPSCLNTSFVDAELTPMLISASN